MFLSMANTIQKTKLYLACLKVNVEHLGSVLKSFIYKFEQIFERFNSEVQDL